LRRKFATPQQPAAQACKSKYETYDNSVCDGTWSYSSRQQHQGSRVERVNPEKKTSTMETKITAGIVIANAFAAPMSIALMKELAQLVILLTHSKT